LLKVGLVGQFSNKGLSLKPQLKARLKMLRGESKPIDGPKITDFHMEAPGWRSPSIVLRDGQGVGAVEDYAGQVDLYRRQAVLKLGRGARAGQRHNDVRHTR